MARVGIVFGVLLCVLAGAGLIGSDTKIPSLVFPMMLGIPILFCGVVSLNPHRRRITMCCAAILAAFGVLAAGGKAVLMAVRISRGVPVNVVAFKLIVIMAVGCTLFVAIYLVWLLRDRAKGTPVAIEAEAVE